MSDQTIEVGATTVFECFLGAGSPKPKVEWFKNGLPLHSSERHYTTVEDQLLIIVRAEVDDTGDYSCRAENSAGTARRSAKLTVGNGMNVAFSVDQFEFLLLAISYEIRASR